MEWSASTKVTSLSRPPKRTWPSWRVRVPRKTDDDGEPTRPFPLNRDHFMGHLLVGGEDCDGARRKIVVPPRSVDVLDLPIEYVHEHLFGLVVVAFDLRARGRHRLGEAFEGKPGALVPVREEEARGPIGRVDLSSDDRQVPVLILCRHESQLPDRRTPPKDKVGPVARRQGARREFSWEGAG